MTFVSRDGAPDGGAPRTMSTDHRGSDEPTGAHVTPHQEPRGRSAARRTLAAAIPVLLGLAVALGLWVGALSTPQKYRATGYVVVVPSTTTSVDQAASLFDSLSKGQVVATSSTMLAQPWWSPGADAAVNAGEVTPSSVIRVAVTSSDADTSRSLLTQTLQRSMPAVNATIKPYEIRRVAGDDVTVERVGLGVVPRVAICALAGVVAAAVAAFLAGALQRRRDGRD